VVCAALAYVFDLSDEWLEGWAMKAVGMAFFAAGMPELLRALLELVPHGSAGIELS
jgi:hypothetical protein